MIRALPVLALAALVLSGCASTGPPEVAEEAGRAVYEGTCENKIGVFYCRSWEVPERPTPDYLREGGEPQEYRRFITIHDLLTDKLLAVVEVINRETGEQRLRWLAPELRKVWPEVIL